MKILYHHRVRSKDGQYVHVEELVGALRALGANVTMVGPVATERDEFGCAGGTVDRLKRLLPRWTYEGLELAYSVVPFLRLLRAARRVRPDVLYERYSLHLLAGLWLRRLLRIPLILEVNAPLARERETHGGLALPHLARAVERAIWRGADIVLPVTAELADEVEAAGVRRGRIMVAPNGVNPAFLAERSAAAGEVRRRYGLGDSVVLGFTGFVRAWHGLDFALEVLARAPDAHLLVVGDGPGVPAVARRAEALGVVRRVHFAGVVPRAAVADHVAAFDVALQPRAVPYACPLKLLEYMAAGRAIVAPDQPNIREAIGADAAALFDPDDRAAFVAATLRLVADAALRARLGAAARRTVLARGFGWEDAAARVLTVAARLVPGEPAQFPPGVEPQREVERAAACPAEEA